MLNFVISVYYRYIHMQDLLRFLGDDEAEKAMEIIEGIPASYKISKRDLRNWVVRIWDYTNFYMITGCI